MLGTSYDAWLTTDREGERHQALWEKYAEAHQTDAKVAEAARYLIARGLTELALGARARDVLGGGMAVAVARWLQEAADVDELDALMVALGLAPGFAAWEAEQAGPEPCADAF